MIAKFDELAITFDNFDEMSTSERIARAKKRKELLKQMSDEEIDELLKRPYPARFKETIKKSRK